MSDPTNQPETEKDTDGYAFITSSNGWTITIPGVGSTGVSSTNGVTGGAGTGNVAGNNGYYNILPTGAGGTAVNVPYPGYTYTVGAWGYGYSGSPITETPVKDKVEGHFCKKCNDYNEFAESNQLDGTFMCYSCRK